MAEFGPAQTSKPLAKKHGPGMGTGILASSPGGKNVVNDDEPDQWAHRFARKPRPCPADGDCPIGSHVHDPSGAAHLTDADGRWALKPLGLDGAP